MHACTRSSHLLDGAPQPDPSQSDPPRFLLNDSCHPRCAAGVYECQAQRRGGARAEHTQVPERAQGRRGRNLDRLHTHGPCRRVLPSAPLPSRACPICLLPRLSSDLPPLRLPSSRPLAPPTPSHPSCLLDPVLLRLLPCARRCPPFAHVPVCLGVSATVPPAPGAHAVHQAKVMSWMNICHIMLVVVMLVIFTTLLHRVLLKEMIKPLEKIFLAINEASASPALPPLLSRASTFCCFSSVPCVCAVSFLRPLSGRPRLS